MADKKKNLWTAFFMILSALLGFGGGEVMNVQKDTTCPTTESPFTECPVTIPDCPIKVIGYVNNCATGETDKYFCDYIGVDAPCKSTDEILSELG